MKLFKVRILLIVLFVFTGKSLFSQHKIVVLGSSTAAGTGASSYANSWVGKYDVYVQSVNASNTLINLAVGGFYTGSIMPTGTGGGEDTLHNITKALSYNPDIIIVNLPSNDASYNIPISTTMKNFRLFRQLANNAGVSFWITTSQPRNLGATGQNLLMETRDSIIAQFGSYVLDFWTTVANPDGSMNTTYSAGDGIHVNDAAHELFFQRVKAKPILGSTTLPVSLYGFKAVKESTGVQLEWFLAGVQNVKQQVQRSYDAVSFSSLSTLPPSNANQFRFLDATMVSKVSYYRIKVESTSGEVNYSDVLRVASSENGGSISVFPNPIKGNLIHMQVNNLSSGRTTIVLVNPLGQEILKKAFTSTNAVLSENITLPGDLVRGIYFLNLIDSNKTYTQPVIVQ